MRTFFYFILTAFIATGCYIAGLNSGHIVIGVAVAMLLWGLFLRYVTRRYRR